jgi:hypothetical protein
MKTLNYSLLCAVLWLFAACASDSGVQQGDLQGTWHLAEAYRDGNKTETLTGAFFRFEAPDKMTTNLLGEDVTTGYTLAKNSIETKGDEPMSYKVAKAEDGKMHLEFEVQGHQFKLLLERAE